MGFWYADWILCYQVIVDLNSISLCYEMNCEQYKGELNMICFDKLLQTIKENHKVQSVTLVEADIEHQQFIGDMILIYPDGQIEGCLIDSDFTSKVVQKCHTQTWVSPVLIELANSKMKVFWDQWAGNRKAIVLGGGHISQPLVQFLSQVNFQVTVVDDRPDFANPRRFPQATRVICNSFSQTILELAPEINSETAIVIVTRGHRYDLECLRKLLPLSVGYLGMIGSRRRIKEMVDLFQAEGVCLASLQRIYAPVGIDIGAATPSEIALSIASEIVAVFNHGSLKLLSQAWKVDAHE